MAVRELTAAVVSGVQVARRAPREDPAYDAPGSASSVTKSQGNVNAYVRVVTNVPNKKGWTNARVTASVPGGSRSSVITRLKTEQAKMVEVPLDLATVSRLRAGKSVSAMVSVKPLGDKSATGDRDTAVLTRDGQDHETEWGPGVRSGRRSMVRAAAWRSVRADLTGRVLRTDTISPST